MKNTYYFDHDYNARNDERILMLRAEFGIEGYGVYWMLIESMMESSTSQLNRVAIGGLSVGFGIEKEKLSKIISYCIDCGLFKEENESFYSTRVIQHRHRLQKLREAGKRGAEKRWGSQENRVAIETPMQRKGKERKEDTYVVRSETESLYEYIQQECEKYGLSNDVKIKALDIQVTRHLGTIRMRPEIQKCLVWLIDKGHRSVTTRRLANWFEKAREIQKRDQNKQLEWKEAAKSPYGKQKQSELMESGIERPLE